MDVLRRGFYADEDDFSAIGFQLRRFIRRENNLAAGRTRRGWEAGGNDTPMSARIDGWMQQLVEAERVDAQHRIVFRNQSLVAQLDRDTKRGLGRALRIASAASTAALLYREFRSCMSR
jgi:hypothetical protein